MPIVVLAQGCGYTAKK